MPPALTIFLLSFGLMRHFETASVKKTGSSAANWTPWSPWTPCTVDCGVGITRRLRTCLHSNNNNNNPTRCVGPSALERACVARPCNADDVAKRVEVVEGRAAVLKCKHGLKAVNAGGGGAGEGGEDRGREEEDVELLWITPRGEQVRRHHKKRK